MTPSSVRQCVSFRARSGPSASGRASGSGERWRRPSSERTSDHASAMGVQSGHYASDRASGIRSRAPAEMCMVGHCRLNPAWTELAPPFDRCSASHAFKPPAFDPQYAHIGLTLSDRLVRERIKDAAKQVKATKAHLGDQALQGGVIVLNSGYYSIAPEDFEELVEHSARNDTRQLSLAVCITASYATDGFNSWMNFKFAPAEGGNEVEQRLAAAFGEVVGEFMTEWGRAGFATPATPAPVPAVVVFTHAGRTFRYFPPNLAPRWTPQSMGG